MSNLNTHRRHWSWRSCFALVKYNKKSKKHQNHHSKSTTNGLTHYSSIPSDNQLNEYPNSSSCIIKIETPSDENESHLIDGDSIEQVLFDQMNSSIINQQLTSMLRSTQLDAIVEDSNEESSDECEERNNQSVRLCSDRQIIDDSNDLHSRLFDLSRMNHVVTQFHENGNLLGEFTRQIDKFKIKIDDIIRVSSQMPRDAELLEARYSTLLASIESLSLLLKISQIPACRSLINRLILSIEQRTQQLQKLVELASISMNNNLSQFRRDFYDDDHLSFRSALSSYEHLFTASS